MACIISLTSLSRFSGVDGKLYRKSFHFGYFTMCSLHLNITQTFACQPPNLRASAADAEAPVPRQENKIFTNWKRMNCHFSEGWCEKFSSICAAVALYLCLIPERANEDVELRRCRAKKNTFCKHRNLTNSSSRHCFTSVLNFCLHYKSATEPANQRTGESELWLAVLSPTASTYPALCYLYCYRYFHCLILI